MSSIQASAAMRYMLGEGIDARMRIDGVAVAHPQREDGGVEMPLQLLQFGVGEPHAEFARDDIEGRHARHDDEQPAGSQGYCFEQPAQYLRQFQQCSHRGNVSFERVCRRLAAPHGS